MVRVESRPAAGGWECAVEVEQGGRLTRHRVKVSAADLERWGAGEDAERLVRRSFEFLLRRERADHILASFDLSVIQRYFPEYDREIRR